MALLIVVSILALVDCLPIANQTSLKEIAPPYVAEPQGRGTISIITSAVLTLILCVWTAIHPNIIAQDPTGSRARKVRIIYVLLALFAPEFILAIAYREWKEATGLCTLAREIAGKAVRKPEDSNQPNPQPPETVNGDSDTGQRGGREQRSPLLDTAPERPLPKKRQVGREPIAKRIRRWLGLLPQKLVSGLPMRAGANEEISFGIECGFFAVMGGFTFSPLGAPEIETRYERTLSFEGFEFLLGNDLISLDTFAKLKNDIKDKGKADTLAKLLACAQALWMLINCLFRAFKGLPLTFIEVNVMIHVACALCMYLLWLKKPNDVHQPISLTSQFKEPVITTMLFACNPSSYCFRLRNVAPAGGGISNHERVVPVGLTNIEVVCLMKNESGLLVEGQWNEWIGMTKLERRVKQSKKQDGVVMLLPGESLVDNVNGFTLDSFVAPTHFTHIELAIFAKAAAGFRDPTYPNIPRSCNETYPKLCIDDQMIDTRHRFRFGNNLYWTAIPLCIAYGGFHLIVWNDHFPTPVERHAWRASCVIILSPSLCISIKVIGRWLCSFFKSPGFQQISRRESDEFHKSFFDGLAEFLLLEVYDDYFRDLSLSFLNTFFLGLVGVLIWVDIHPNFPTLRITLDASLGGAIVLRILYMVKDMVGEYDKYVNRNYFPSRAIAVIYVMDMLGLVIVGLGWCLYVAARVYIIVEAFVSLRSVPWGAFETVAWTNVWPHF